MSFPLQEPNRNAHRNLFLEPRHLRCRGSLPRLARGCAARVSGTHCLLRARAPEAASRLEKKKSRGDSGSAANLCSRDR